MTGGAVGSLAHTMLPACTASPGAYALVGMGTAFAGIVRVPLTSVIMIFEMTRDYSITVSLGFAGLLLTSLRLQCVKSWMSRRILLHWWSVSNTRGQQEGLSSSLLIYERD